MQGQPVSWRLQGGRGTSKCGRWFWHTSYDTLGSLEHAGWPCHPFYWTVYIWGPGG